MLLMMTIKVKHKGVKDITKCIKLDKLDYLMMAPKRDIT